MYIGKLNYSAPTLPLSVKRDTLWERPLELKLSLDQPAFVDRITLRFGETTCLKSVSIAGYSCHAAETGKHITARELTLQVSALCEELDLIIQADYTDIDLEELTVYGAMEDGIALFPTPDFAETDGRTFPAANYTTYTADPARKAAAILTEKWEEETGLTLRKAENGAIRFVKGDLPANGYTLEITETAVTLTAADERGFVIAAETLIKLLEGGTLPACRIHDTPAHPFRGVHLMLPGVEEMDFAKRLIKYLISPMGYNAVILELAGAMEYKSHPLINQKMEEAVANGKAGIWPRFAHDSVGAGKTVPQETVRDFVDYIRSFGIEPIPEVQSLGHVQYMTQAYPEIAELDEVSESLIDTRTEDTRPNKFYKHCFCPSNPRSYEILFDLLDEVIDVFRPTEYVHMGHDEIYEIGVCKVCRTKNPADLLADDLNKLHAYLKEKGLKMMIWSDMLQPRKNGRLTHPAADRIPKDILMLDFIWYFHLEDDIEDHLLQKDFKVAVGNLYSSHYPRYNSRITKPGMVGGQTSAWVGTNVNALAQEGKLFDFRLTAQMLWSKDYRPEYTNVYSDYLLKTTPALREKLEGIVLPSLYGEPTAAELPQKGQSLLVTHALARPVTKEPWKKGPKVGEYLLTYADGSTQRHELFAGRNIDVPRHPFAPNPHKLYRHTGYYADYFCTPTADGLYQIEIPLKDEILCGIQLLPEKDVAIDWVQTEIIE